MTTKRVHHESSASPSSSITPPKKKQKREEENHLGGVYWNRISQLSERVNIRALSLNDLLERIHPIASIHFNYMIDTEWLIRQYPSNCRHTPITLVVGERMGTDYANVKRHSARYSNVNIARAMIKIPFGTHHTKLSIFESDDNKIYVAVITANLIEGDWREKTQGFYLACGSLNESSSSISSQFSTDLCAYLQFYRDTGTPKDEWQLIEYWHDRLKSAEFSTVTDRHRLVYSIPGYHQKSMMNEFGHLRLRKLLKDVEANNSSFIAQCSSLGSLGAKPEAWLTGQFLESLAGGRRQGADKFRLIYPSINNVRMSFEGYQAGGSLPYQKATSNRQPWLIQFLHQWRSDKLERSRASPHIKTYTAISRETRKPNWLLLTSANVSKAAWGEIQKNNTQLMIRSYELGVLLLPGDEEQLELPYDYPLLKYGYCMPRDCRDEKVLNYLDDVLLFESDVALLKPGCWLNDQLITFALRYSLEQLPEDVRQKIAVLEPTVVEILKFGDFSLQQSIWSDLQLGNKELLLLAINDNPDPNTRNGAGSHWSLLVVRNHRNFEHLDSCGEFNVTVARQIAKSCSKNSQTAGQDHFLSVKVPKQANGSDCGLYLIEFTREYLQKMLTPVFELNQTENHLVIRIRAPYANIADTEIEYDDREFLFTACPYFLRLYLPAPVINDEESGTAEYDSDKGEFLIHVPKKNRGEHFERLEMITELLKGKKEESISAQPLVEEVEDERKTEDEDEKKTEDERKTEDEDEGKTNAFVEQNIAETIEEVAMDDRCKQFGYGFAARRLHVFEKLQCEIGSLIDLSSPDETPIAHRLAICQLANESHFDEEHYLADLFTPDDQLIEAINFSFPSDYFQLNDKHRERLKELHRRKLPILTGEEQQWVSLSLIDLLFAYLYDARTTEGEHSVESGWNIVKLSPSLSHLVVWKNVEETMKTTLQSALCYPLYRNWQLALKVLEDVKMVISKGASAILRCLIDIEKILSISGDYRYLLNDLFITDYCIWIQSVPDSLIIWLSEELGTVKMFKSMMDLDLEELELVGKMQTMELEREGEGPLKKRRQLTNEDDVLKQVAKAAMDSDDEQT